MKFKNYGPFYIELDQSRRLPRQQKDYWTEVEGLARDPGLPDAHGIYIFGIQSRGGGPYPWYVGQTQCSFRQECFQPQKKNHYQYAISGYEVGNPFLMFIAHRTESDREFSSPPSNNVKGIDELEGLMIGKALARNSSLLNVKNTNFWSKLVVPGILNTPQGAVETPTKTLKKMLGI